MFFLPQAKKLRKKTEMRLQEYSQPRASFFILISLASSIATLGMFLDSVAIVIGAMVVAPLVTPIFGFSLSIIVLKLKNMAISLLLIFLGTVLAIACSIIITSISSLVIGEAFTPTFEILARADPNLLYFLVALFSGMAGAYAYYRPQGTASITGIAISVAIIPPLAVTGLAIAIQDWFLVGQSFLLYLLNLSGICFGSVIMFLFLGFGTTNQNH